MIKSKAFKIAVMIIVTILLAVSCGYLASIAVKAILYDNVYKDSVETAIKRIDSYYISITDNLENSGLMNDKPSIEFEKTRGFINKKINFSVENFIFEINMAYRVFNNTFVITMSVSETEKFIHDIDAFENKTVNCVFSIVDKCFEIESFIKSSEFCDTSFLIENFNLNKNDSGIAEYSFATHESVFDAFSLHKTGIVYKYSVSEGDLGYEYNALITKSVAD